MLTSNNAGERERNKKKEKEKEGQGEETSVLIFSMALVVLLFDCIRKVHNQIAKVYSFFSSLES